MFKDELGLLKGIQENATVDEAASPHFHKPRPAPFVLKEKVEQQLDKQIEEVNLSLLIKVSGQLLIVVHKKDRGIRIYGDFKISINPFLHPLLMLKKMFTYYQMDNHTHNLT